MHTKVISVLESAEFLTRLNQVNKHFPNLKQESLIRNSILELLNEKFLGNEQRAFAEHPKVGTKRIDLSIHDQSNKQSFCIEFKFQFTNDFGMFINYKKLVDNDFHRILRDDIHCDMFILIVSRWNIQEKEDYEQQWGVHSSKQSLSKYLSKGTEWKDNLVALFDNYSDVAQTMTIERTVNEPYKTDYSFYIMNRILNNGT